MNHNHDKKIENELFVGHTVDIRKQNLKFFWKNDNGVGYGNFLRLKQSLKSKGQKLTFAMNGGMYLKDRSPQGLYIEHGEVLSKLNTVKEAYGNFYLQPNGVFAIYKNNTAKITVSSQFKLTEDIKYATQSGPMLVIDGKTHSKFTKGSKNVHIRNGVGILPNGQLLFVISSKEVNLYDFAQYFKEQKCKNALYLDGFVSRMYLPEKEWTQTDGNFGVIIAEIEAVN